MTSGEFDTHLDLQGADLIEVARNDDRSTTIKNSEIKALLAPGTYTLTVSSSKPGGRGSYAVSYLPTNPSADECQDTFIVRGVTVSGIVYGNDCQLIPFEFSDRYVIHLDAGSQVQILVEDFSYSGPNIEMVAPNGSSVMANPGGNYLTTLVYVAPVEGYYTVLVGLLNEIGTTYKITVR